MPMGKGTYGSQVGRPKKKITKKPKGKQKDYFRMASMAQGGK